MVCGFLADHLSSFAAAVVGIGLAVYRVGYGLYGDSVRRHFASRNRRLPLLLTLGEPARCFVRGAGQRLSWFGVLSDFDSARTAIYHICRAALLERAALSLHLGPAWKLAIFY